MDRTSEGQTKLKMVDEKVEYTMSERKRGCEEKRKEEKQAKRKERRCRIENMLEGEKKGKVRLTT